MSNQIGSRPDPDLAAFTAQVGQLEQDLAAIALRLARLEQSIAALGKQASESRDRVEADIGRIRNQLEEQAATLESSRTAAVQTDDLVERVVEAFESLQSRVLEPPEDQAADVN
ncbi:MAG: hypothetical protein ABSE42_05285 [Bryobacteraceae bacterium]